MSWAFAARMESEFLRIAAAAAVSAASFCAVAASRNARAAVLASRPISNIVCSSDVLFGSKATVIASVLRKMFCGLRIPCGEGKLVAVNHFIASAIAQQRLDFGGPAPRQPLCIFV